MATAPGAAFDELVRIMRTLRAPGGCPWDRAQTLQSLRPFVREETDELLDAFKEMTLLELSEFVKQFEETFDVTAAAPVAVAAGVIWYLLKPQVRSEFVQGATA